MFMNIMERVARRLKRYWNDKSLISRDLKHLFWRTLPSTLNVGGRNRCVSVDVNGVKAVKKIFLENRESYLAEVKAGELFGNQPWFPQVMERGDNFIVLPLFDGTRLDLIAPQMDSQTREHVCDQAISALASIHQAGYAHRDFHTKNLFWQHGKLYVTDFETLTKYPGKVPSFPQSYDLIGQGLESPFQTGHMCYSSPHEFSLQSMLHIPLDKALKRMEERLLNGLREVSATFETRRKKSRRHSCRANRIYGSFRLPFLSVHPDLVQRNSQQRFAKFGIDQENMRGKTVVDLGSNIGAMSFTALEYGASSVLGLEFDKDKVELAHQVSCYNGLTNAEFRQANIDTLDPVSMGGPFDIVFCLAVEAHVENVDRLYSTLRELTGQILYFEGNSSTERKDVETRLREVGFKSVEFLGVSDDDCLEDNNKRPLFIARVWS